MITAHEHLTRGVHMGSRLIPIVSRIATKTVLRKHLVSVLKLLNPFSSKDDIERMGDVVESSGKTCKELLGELKTYFPRNTQFFILAIDQTYMGVGKILVSYEEQLDEIVELIKQGENIKLFMMIDCRRPNYMELVYKYEKYITGFKVYNLMGTFPYDEGYLDMLNYAKKNNKHIIYHCSKINLNYYRGNDIDERLKSSKYPLFKVKWYKQWSKKEKSKNFGNFQGILEVIKENPEVNFQIAHLGGNDEVKEFLKRNEIELILKPSLITKPIEQYTYTFQILYAALYCKNIYFDISFSFHTTEAQVVLKQILKHKILKHRVVFGTDFPVNKSVTNMGNFTKQLKKIIGSYNFHKISYTNIQYLLKNK